MAEYLKGDEKVVYDSDTGVGSIALHVAADWQAGDWHRRKWKKLLKMRV
jgi:hypothetical protein